MDINEARAGLTDTQNAIKVLERKVQTDPSLRGELFDLYNDADWWLARLTEAKNEIAANGPCATV